jgi:hypothetical protein
MNERIKELYKQAAQFGQDDYNNRRRNRGPLYEEDELTNIVNQKFAELIVRECLDVMSKTSEEANKRFTYMGDDVPTVVHQMNIEKHFGVRE